MTVEVKSQIEKIVGAILDTSSTEEIILFGSYAYGEPTVNSDIDLCIITSDKNKKKKELTKEIRKSIAPVISVAVDLLVYEKEDFYSRASLNTTLEYLIKNEGVRLYEQ